MRATICTLLTLAGIGFLPLGNAWGQTADGLSRAGCPHQVANYARFGYGPKYVAYYVGGGAPARKGEPRCVDEGTFGIDYKPIVPGFRRTTSLGWWHGRRLQGGPGQYEPNAHVSPFANNPK